MNFQVSIDGSAQTQFQFNGVCVTCDWIYNFTAYNIQWLDSGNHTLDLTLLNAIGSDAFGNSTTFYFDYAAVNETDAFSTQATSSTSTVPTSTPSTPASTPAPTPPAPSAQ
jgi:hypothetical protein